MCCVLGPPRMSPAPLSSSPASTQPPLQGQAVDWTRIQMVGGGPHPIFGKQRFDEERCQQQQPAGGTCACYGVAASTPGVTLKKCSRCKAVACELVWVAVARLLAGCGECSSPCMRHAPSLTTWLSALQTAGRCARRGTGSTGTRRPVCQLEGQATATPSPCRFRQDCMQFRLVPLGSSLAPARPGRPC